ncbi:MAG: DUF4190 domain-containing protein [Bacteroidia bacterium]
MRLRSYLYTLLAFAVLTSCSIQRRNYRSGFYIDRKNSTAQKEPVRKAKKREIVSEKIPVTEVFVNTDITPKNATASLSEKEIKPVYTKTKTYIDNCDTIIFRDGTEILAKVIEVGTSEIKYKNCDNQSGPTYIVEKNKVNFIIYSNGQSEQFKVETAPIANKYDNSTESDRMTLKMARTSMIYGIIGFVGLSFYGVGGIIMGLCALAKSRRAMERIGRNKDHDKRTLNYAAKGQKYGRLALMLGAAILIAWILLYLWLTHVI